MKKLISGLIALVMLCALLVMPASAAGNGSLSMSSASGYRGDTVTLNVNLNSNPGLVTMTIRVSYDTSVLQLTNVSNPGLLVGAQLNTNYGSPYTISWVDGATTTNNTATGTIASFTFKILDNAAAGNSAVTLQFIDSYDTDYNENSFTAYSGAVTVICNHNYGNWSDGGNGKHVRICSLCSGQESADHAWNNGAITKQPTCKEEGVKAFSCTVCSGTKTEPVAKTTTHTYGAWTKVDDTTHKHTCSVCSKEETASHTWNNGVVTKQPTCKEEGVKTFTCSGCGGTKTEPVTKTNTHTYGVWTKVDDTTHKHTCSVCSKEETASHTWNNGVVTKQPTCKEEGVKTFTCSGCNGTKTEPVEKTTTHTYGAWTKVDDTTHKHTCSVCSKEETASHTWNSGNITKQPTCKEEGVKTFTCSGCNGTKTEPVEKTTTHTYGAWTNVDDTTHKHTCSVCSKEETASHTWNSGNITKQPTCKEEGVKTFTCTGCNGTKTEPVGKTTTHTYGAWTKVDDTTHKHTCSVCSKEETASHTWNSGNITKQATCKEEGVKTFTCTGCNATYTEVVEKLTTHTYDHNCDTDCNVCGAERTTEHTYRTYWSSDAANHWHECSSCKDKKDSAAHTPGAAATEQTAQICTVCSYVITPALGHTHNYATTWTIDDDGHWYTCSGCSEKGSYATHDFENACDTDCAVCEFTRETKHQFAEAWIADADNHWHVCSGCGLTQDEASHEPGAEATATTPQTCTICNYEVAPALGVEETSAPSETITPANPDDVSDNNFPFWIIVVAALAAIAGISAFLILKKKKS